MNPAPGVVVFSMFANSQAQSKPGVMGPWAAAATTDLAGMSFAEGEGSGREAGVPEGIIWRNDLPLDAVQTERSFEQAEASLEGIQAALEATGLQVETMIQHQVSEASFAIPHPSSDVSLFDLFPSSSTMASGLPQSEREKLAAEQRQRLHQLERDTLGMITFSSEKGATTGVSFSTELGWDAVSFGPLADISSKWNQATRQFQDFIAHLGQVIGNFAWVETRLNGQLLARTSINWTGDMETAWQIHPDIEQVRQHERTLQLALASRIMLLRTFIAVAANAVKLSALVTTPAGAILALPTSLNLVNQIISEQARYQQQIKEMQNGD